MPRIREDICITTGRHCPVLAVTRQFFEITPDCSIDAEKIDALAQENFDDMVEGAQEMCAVKRCGVSIMAASIAVRNEAYKDAYDDLYLFRDPTMESDLDLDN